jgi:Rrf2 family cysteine metabolism transcriptional repressor
VQLSAKAQYASLAAIELARQYQPGIPVQIRQISDRLEIPARFLVQILLQLKGAGLVVSTRGSAGGYQLARPPQDIQLVEIVDAVESSSDSPAAAGGPDPERAVLALAWQQAHQAFRQVLANISLRDLLQKISDQHDPMYFI